MGIGSFFKGGGGFGQHNPMYRRQAEDMGMLSNLAQMWQANPKAVERYFQTDEGRVMQERLGLDSVASIGDFAIPGMSTLDDYSQIYENLEAMPGDQMVDYERASYDPYQFQMQDVQDIGDAAFEQAQLAQEEAAARGFEKALLGVRDQMGDRGFRPGSGMNRMANTALGRNLMTQYSDIGRQMGLTQAQNQQDLAKWQAQQDFQRQQAQNAANQFASQFQSGQNQFASQFQRQQQDANRNFQLQQQNAMANALGMIDQKAMQPYNMMQNYFGQTAALTGPPKTKSPFERVVGGIGSLADTAGKVGSIFTGGAV